MTDKRGAKPVIVIGTIITIITTVAFALFVHFNSLGIYYALAAFTLSGLGSGMFWTAARIYVVNRSHLKASANVAFNFMSFSGATLAPFVGSIIFSAYGVFVLFLSFAILMTIALLLLMRKA